MKKRFLVGLLSFMMVFATACGSTPDANDGGGTGEDDIVALSPYERLEAANGSYEDADSIVMDFTMDMDMIFDGETLMNLVMSGDITMIAEDEDDIQFAMVTKNDYSMMGETESTELTAYYKDGYYYMEMEGQGFKMLMPMEEAMDQAAVSNVDFDENHIISQDQDGNVLTFVVDGEAMTEFFDEAMGDFMASMGDASLTYSDVTYIVHLNDNEELERMDMECTMDIEVMGEAASVTLAMTMNIKEVGSNITIDFPADLDSYMEIDSSLLGL